jgi:hypothetical protein
MRTRPSKPALVLSLALAATALTSALPQLTASARACGSYTPSFVGVVKSINVSKRTVIISYEGSTEGTFTTASFSSWDREQIAHLKPRDKVAFEFFGADDAGRFTLGSIRVLKRASEQKG